MRVRINIDFELSPRQKRLLLGGVVTLTTLVASIAYATVPNTFKDGDTLSAQTMNDNFTALDTRLAKIEALSAKQTADGGLSIGATYCGATGNTVGDMSALPVGSGTGYPRARTQCQSTCSSPGAHMCTADEVLRSAQLGLTVPQGWYSTAIYGANANYDCNGWTLNTSGGEGTLWGSSGGAFVNETNCNVAEPVLCCN